MSYAHCPKNQASRQNEEDFPREKYEGNLGRDNKICIEEWPFI